MFDEQLEFSNKHNLPKVTALYGVYAEDELLYIGVSWNLNTRFKSHHRLNDFCKENATCIKWRVCEDKEKLYAEEHRLIRSLYPRLNVALNRRSTVRPVMLNTMEKPHYESNPKLACNFTKFVFNLVWEYLDSSKNRKQAIRELASLAGITESWLESFARGKVVEPGINKLETLYFYLTGKELEL